MLYLSAVVLSFFLSFVLLTKRQKSYSDYLLLGWLLLTGTHIYAHYLFVQGSWVNYPSLVVVGFSLPLIQGPFLYLYTRTQLTAQNFRFTDLLHFLPVLLSMLAFADFHLLPYDAKVTVFRNSGKGYEARMLINLLAVYVSGVVYIFASFRRLIVYRKNIVNRFSNTEKIRLDWLLYLMIWLVVIWTAILVTRNDTLIFGSASLFVLWLGYFGIRQVKIFDQPQPETILEEPSTLEEKGDAPVHNAAAPEKEFPAAPAEAVKYGKSSLSENDATLIYERLKQVLAEQKPFTNPELKLDDLAKLLDVHPNHLSQVINSKEKKNFYDMINELRIREFIDRVAQPANRQFTILAIAYDAGFNSKTSFNRNFKKYTGYTPSDYLRRQTGAEEMIVD